mgnify:CR=1 FL=1
MLVKGTKSEDSRERYKAKIDPILVEKQHYINKWIDENVHNMDDVKQYLKRLTRVVKSGHKSQKN